jgi:hypothetical protein
MTARRRSVKGAAVPLSVKLGLGVPQPDAAHQPRLQPLADGHRAIDELQLRGQDRDLDTFSARSRSQRLQLGDATAGDRHARPRHDPADAPARPLERILRRGHGRAR